MPSRSLDSLPSPKGLPILGNLLAIPHDRYHLAFESFAREYGDLFTLAFGPKRVLVCAVPEIARQTLRERPHNFRRIKNIKLVTDDLGLTGLFPAEGADWQRQRRIVNPAFRKAHLAAFHPHLIRIAQRLRAKWSEAVQRPGSLDVRDLFLRYTVDVTTLLAFEHDLNTLESNSVELQSDIELVFKLLNARMNAPFPYWHYIRLPLDRAAEAAVGRIRKAISGAIEHVRTRLERSPSIPDRPRSLLEALLVARDEDGQALSDEDVYASVVSILMAGEDTTANTITWALHEAARRPDIQSRLADEARHVLGDSDVVPDTETAARLTYTTAVISEALRLRPPGPILGFEPIEDMVLGGVEVPAGTPIFVLLRLVSLADPGLTAPMMFSPERWLEQEGRARQAPKDNYPFGSGPRICPGLSLAYLEAQTAISMVMKSFEIVPDTSSHVLERHNFVMEPHGVRVFAKRRPNAEQSRRLDGHSELHRSSES